MNADYADDLALFVNKHAQAIFLSHSLEQPARSSWFDVNLDKTEVKCFKPDGVISTSNDMSPKLEDHFS